MKYFYLLILATLLSIFAFGQVGLGLKGGLNSTTLNDFYLETRSIKGFHLGAIANIPISKMVFLQTELSYSIKGTQYYTQLTRVMFAWETLKLCYISTSILIGIQTNQKP